MDGARLVGGDRAGILGVAVGEPAGVFLLEAAAAAAEAGGSVVVDERPVGEHGPVAAAVGPHHQVVLLVVAGAVGLVEESELREDPPPHQQAEADRRRDVVEVGQVGRQQGVIPLRLRGGAVSQGLGGRQAGDRGVVRPRADEGDHRVAARHAHHLGDRPGEDERVGVEQEHVAAGRDRRLHATVGGPQEAEVLRVGEHLHRQHPGAAVARRGQRLRQRRVVGRVVDGDHRSPQGGQFAGALQQRIEQRPHQPLVAVERNHDRQASGRGDGVRGIHAEPATCRPGIERAATGIDPTVARGRVNRRGPLLDARRSRK